MARLPVCCAPIVIRSAFSCDSLCRPESPPTRSQTTLTRSLGHIELRMLACDQDILRLMSPALGALHVNQVQSRNVSKWFVYLLGRGQSHGSIKRYRASLSSSFTWCIEETHIATNPVTGTKLPSQTTPPSQMRPFTEEELKEAWQNWRQHSSRLADVMLIAGWTGLRWGELRALTVSDFIQMPGPALIVPKSHSEGGATKPTESYETRRVPLANRILPSARALAANRDAGAVLFTGESGGQLWRSSVIRSLDWPSNSAGRRIHDLRYTAACL